jgi:hypothetical protein
MILFHWTLPRFTFGINYMIYKKIWIKWLLVLVGLCSIFYIIGSIKKAPHVPIVLANTSGLSSTTQADFAKISENGAPNVMLQLTNDFNGRGSDQELKSSFSYGYIIMGLQNGQVAYDLHLKDIRISADWNDAILSFSSEGNWGYVYIPHLQISNLKNNSEFGQIDTGQYFPLEYPEPFRWNLSTLPGIPCAFLKVLDQENKLLLIGFNSSK